MKREPAFTIFTPVKNGGRYISLCVESILAQSYGNFELIILAGYSSDGTCEWLKSKEVQDCRIKVIFSDVELGIEGNWKRILATPKNEFMTIVGYDDVLDSNFLETIAKLISQNPDASLYQTHFRLIDAKGSVIRKCMPMQLRQGAAGFLQDIFNFKIDCFATGYVMRSQDYEKVNGIPLFHNLMFADYALWIVLAKLSWKATSAEECFSFRIHAKSTSVLSSGFGYLEGLGQFMAFLDEQAKNNPEIADVCRDGLGRYVLVAHRAAYFSYLFSASQKNIILPNSVKKSIQDSLEKLQPAQLQAFNSSMLIRLLEQSNKSIFRKYIAAGWGAYRAIRSTVRDLWGHLNLAK